MYFPIPFIMFIGVLRIWSIKVEPMLWRADYTKAMPEHQLKSLHKHAQMEFTMGESYNLKIRIWKWVYANILVIDWALRAIIIVLFSGGKGKFSICQTKTNNLSGKSRVRWGNFLVATRKVIYPSHSAVRHRYASYHEYYDIFQPSNYFWDLLANKKVDSVTKSPIKKLH